jgi:hypothetical protein
LPFWITSSAAPPAATPAIARKREPPVRPSPGTRSVSPCTTLIFAASMPSFCDRSWTNVVVCPWPLSCMPE